jgi:malonyl-CoA O-methyltransferase
MVYILSLYYLNIVKIMDMSIKKEFSKYANEYNDNNIIQKIVAKSLIRDIKGNPKKILELGSGTGQIYKDISWDTNYYKAVDFSQNMCDLHPRNINLDVECCDFDTDFFWNSMKNDRFDIVISSSSLQWSKNIDNILKNISYISSDINLALFTSNTFKAIQKITNNPSPILSIDNIKNSCSKYFKCEFEIIEYKLEFENKKDIFKYIKNSGVSGQRDRMGYKESKNLFEKYHLNYLEFEVIFVKGVLL